MILNQNAAAGQHSQRCAAEQPRKDGLTQQRATQPHSLNQYLVWVRNHLPEEGKKQKIALGCGSGSEGNPGVIDPVEYRVLRGDSASYFTCDETTEVANKHGAMIRLSSAGSQARNGIVGRWLGAIGEAGESMRYAAAAAPTPDPEPSPLGLVCTMLLIRAKGDSPVALVYLWR